MVTISLTSRQGES